MHALSPAAVAATVARSGVAVVAEIDESESGMPGADHRDWEVQGRKAALLAKRSGAIQAVYAPGIIVLATEHDLTCVFRCTVADFADVGGVIMDVYGGPEPRVLRRLRGMDALGQPKGIPPSQCSSSSTSRYGRSPAVNDPTTW